MTAVEFSDQRFQRVLAAGAWGLLLVLLPFVNAMVSPWVAMGLVGLVALSSTVSLLIFNRSRVDIQSPSVLSQRLTMGVTWAVPMIWAFQLSGSQTVRVDILLWLLAVVPPLAGLVALRATSNTARAVSSLSQRVAVDHHEFAVERSPATDSTMTTRSGGSPDDLDLSMTAGLSQWLRRSTTDHGEMIEGGIRVDFKEGQREVIVHIAFCPPFDTVPEVMAEDLDGLDLEIRVAATYRFGTRFHVRRQIKSERTQKALPAISCPVGFVADALNSQRVA